MRNFVLAADQIKTALTHVMAAYLAHARQVLPPEINAAAHQQHGWKRPLSLQHEDRCVQGAASLT